MGVLAPLCESDGEAAAPQLEAWPASFPPSSVAAREA